MIEYAARAIFPIIHVDRIRLAWTEHALTKVEQGLYWTPVDGWYLATSREIHGQQIVFGKGRVDLSRTQHPFVTSVTEESVYWKIVDGVVTDGPLIAQVVFDAMFKRISRLSNMPLLTIVQRKVKP